jgi:hypothetical protein
LEKPGAKRKETKCRKDAEKSEGRKEGNCRSDVCIARPTPPNPIVTLTTIRKVTKSKHWKKMNMKRSGLGYRRICNYLIWTERQLDVNRRMDRRFPHQRVNPRHQPLYSSPPLSVSRTSNGEEPPSKHTYAQRPMPMGSHTGASNEVSRVK